MLGLLVALAGNIAFGLVIAPIKPGINAHLSARPSDGALQLSIGCHVPPDQSPASFYRGILTDASAVSKYSSVRNVALPFDTVNPELRRAALLAIFELDWVDEAGWHHVVLYDDPGMKETMWSLCQWLTGNGINWHAVQDANDRTHTQLARGEQILIPRSLLLPEYVKPTDRGPVQPQPQAMQPNLPPIPDPVDDPLLNVSGQEVQRGDLTFKEDSEGKFAEYRLKKGEALYTDVVIRFTDYTQHTDVMFMTRKLLERSGVQDPRAIDPGTPIKIPIEILSDPFQPTTTVARQQYEESVRASERVREQLRQEAVSLDLAGIVVVLDAGHGSADPGRKDTRMGLYEDEIAYDIMCRVKRILERDTAAQVHVTILDPDLGYQVKDTHQFTHDKDEVILTTPRYPPSPDSTKVVLNLRYYLANDIYDRVIEQGVDPKHVVFTSFHVDALGPSLRGSMIYVPGAEDRSRSPITNHTNYPYNRIREVKRYESSASERIRDEAWSRAFAQTLYEELGKKRIQRHKHGPAIRNVVRQPGGVRYVPAVIRWNKIPTKILFETANMVNATDRQRLADPQWREWVAEAYVNALRAHYAQST